MKILDDFAEKIKCCKEEVFLVSIIVLSGLFGFGLGRLSVIEARKTPIVITEETDFNTESKEAISASDSYFVASKNGTKYYFSWCEGVKRINEENIVKFNTREEAESAGFEKATNCPGL